jgi:hypothetical protein
MLPPISPIRTIPKSLKSLMSLVETLRRKTNLRSCHPRGTTLRHRCAWYQGRGHLRYRHRGTDPIQRQSFGRQPRRSKFLNERQYL